MGTKQRWKITEAEARVDASLCQTRAQFHKRYGGSWRHLQKKGLLDSACSHMTGKTQWTVKKCLVEALKYETRNEFKKGNHGAWCYCQTNGLKDIMYAHMGPSRPKGRKKDLAKLEKLRIQSECEHDLVWRGRNQQGKLYKCTKCEKIVVVKKTDVEKIADLIRSKIAR